MAGVNKIDEYKRPSSTEAINSQYGVPPKNVVINDSTANAVKKDYDQGNVDLNNGQVKFLDSRVDEDTLDYSDDEMRNVGEQQIDADNTENTKAGNAVGTMAGSVAGAAAGAVANAVGTAIHQNMMASAAKKVFSETQKGLQTQINADGTITQTQTNQAGIDQASKESERVSKIPFGAVIAGGIAIAGAALGMVSVNKFDDQFKDRISKRDEAANTNTLIQQYYDTLGSDMDAMTEETALYTELCNTQLESDVDLITELGALQAEMQVYESQGNTQKVGELKKEIENRKKAGEEDSLKGEMDGIKESLDTYSGNNAEASGVAASGESVSEFLEDGKQMGAMAAIQAALLTVSAVIMLKGTVNAARAALKVPFPLNTAASACAVAGAVMLVAANVTTALAAAKMFSKMKDEFKCADAGGEMSGYVASLNENVVSQSGFVETATAGYEEEDAAAAETTQKTQEGVDKANEKQAEQLAQTPQPQPESTPDSTPASTAKKTEPVVTQGGQGETAGTTSGGGQGGADNSGAAAA